MKRTLINFDALKRMEKDSLTTAGAELAMAEEIIGSTIEKDIAGLHSFTADSVVYETVDGAFLHANYKVENDHIILENIEELVVDEESEKAAAKAVLGRMVEAILEGEDSKAAELFNEYISLGYVRRTFRGESLTEATFTIRKLSPTRHGPLYKKKQPRSLVRKRAEARRRSNRKRSKGEKQRASRERERMRNSMPKRRGTLVSRPVVRWKKKMVKECFNLCENVAGYLDYKEFGPILDEVKSKSDDKGNVVALRLPNSQLRNEAKILSFNWNTLDHKVKVHRVSGKKLAENQEFCKDVAELKTNTATSDNPAIEEAIDSIVVKYPNVLYLTQDELAAVVAEALAVVGAKNYDDNMCNFMAEGILRKAHEAYSERVDTIVQISGLTMEKAEDAYEGFQDVVKEFYPTLDESASAEMQIFVDLYNAVRLVHEEATQHGDEIVAEEAAYHLKDLMAVVTQDIQPDLELAEEVTEWLYDLVETNLDSEEWNVSNSVHTTVSGDHPQMAKNAKKGYTPASDFSGDWGDVAPVSDGKSYRNGEADKMRNRSYGNLGGDDVNPYIPQAGDFTMKGEQGVDKATDGLVYRSGNTWPELTNPHVPDAPGADGWRMKSDNLVIDQ